MASHGHGPMVTYSEVISLITKLKDIKKFMYRVKGIHSIVSIIFFVCSIVIIIIIIIIATKNAYEFIHIY